MFMEQLEVFSPYYFFYVNGEVQKVWHLVLNYVMWLLSYENNKVSYIYCLFGLLIANLCYRKPELNFFIRHSHNIQNQPGWNKLIRKDYTLQYLVNICT